MRGSQTRAFLLGAVLILLLLSGGCFLFAPPEPPTDVSASDGEYLDQVLVTWSSSRGASRYEVFRATEEDGDYEKIGETGATRFSDTEASANVLYWYRVRACNQFGCSAFSQADSGWRLGQMAPSVPRNVQASDGTFSDRIRVTWSASPGASSYEIWRSDVRDADYFKIDTATGTSYEDTGVIRGRTYWYKIKACNSYGCSDFSAPDSGIAVLQIPAAPQNVQASDGTYSDRVRITWSAVSGAARYEIHRASSSAGTYTFLGDSPSTTYDDTTVTVGTTYWYKVRAWNALGYGPFSEPDSGYAAAGGGGGGGGHLPSQPQNVQASDGTYHDKIRITWDAVSCADAYRIYFSATGELGTFTQIAEVPHVTKSYEDTRDVLQMCREYWYAVSAWNEMGESPLSVPDSGYRGGSLEQVKTDKIKVTVTPSSTSATEATVKLEWSGVKDAEKLGVYYEIWRRVPPHVPTRVATTSDHTSLSHEEVVEIGKTYYYKIRACSHHECIPCGLFSEEVRVVVVCAPEPPETVSASRVPGENRITITWSAVLGVQAYQIYRATSAEGSYTFVAEVPSTQTTYTDSPPVPSSGTVTYYYKVKTCVPCGCGGLSKASNGVKLP